MNVAAERRQSRSTVRGSMNRVSGLRTRSCRGVVPRREQVVAGAEAEVALPGHELDLAMAGGELGQVVSGGVVEHEHARLRRVREHGRQAGLEVLPSAVVDELDGDVEPHAAIIGSPWAPPS